LTILIIDDSKSDRDLLELILNKSGYDNVVTAASVGEGMVHLTNDIQLVLMDVMMPDVDGITGCAMIREQKLYFDLPIIIVTSNKDISTLELAFETGANDYITKPFNKLELLARVRVALNLKSEIDKRKKREQELECLTVQLSELTEELKEKNQILQKLSTMDSLTDIANRRKFDEVLEQTWKRVQRNKGTISLIMLDIDNFKAYNDNYGHQQGDIVLKQVAQAIKEIPKRVDDLVARYGGEEFAIILPDTTVEGAIAIATLIQERIQQLQIKHEYSGVKDVLTVSLGICSFPSCHNLTSKQLIERADIALYEAKKSGGNDVYVFECS